MALAHEIARMVGFDECAGVIAQSAHPFTGSPHRGDVRFTTRLMPDSPLGNISAVLHELGHALYEQGFPGRGRPHRRLRRAVPRRARVAVALLGEPDRPHAGPSGSSIEPAMRRLFPEAMTGIDAGLLHRAARVVRPSLIRVEADEVTYNLHIVLRFEIELALMRGDLEVADLPGAFSDGMQELLGIRPPTDALGAMQDIHWADGLFGYFPTYTLGQPLRGPARRGGRARARGRLERAIAEGRFGDDPRLHARAGAPPRRAAADPRADAPRDRRRARLGRPDRPPGALLPPRRA